MIELDRSLSSTSNASSESDWGNDNEQVDEGALVGAYDESTINFNSNR